MEPILGPMGSRLLKRVVMLPAMMGAALAFWRTGPLDDAYRTARRYFAVAALILSTALGTWQRTFSHPGLGADDLDDLVARAARGHPGLSNTASWCIGFFGVDTLLFIPAYFGLIILLARLLQQSLAADQSPSGSGVPSARGWVAHFQTAVTVCALALAASDLVENVFAVVALSGQEWAYWIFHAATPVKLGLTAVVAALLLGGLWVWLAGGFLESNDPRKAQRMGLRANLMDVIIRTRYVWWSLIVYAAVLLGLDQARDVLVGLGVVIDVWAGGVSWWSGELWGAVLALVLGLFAVHCYGHVCWLWGRLTCRIRREDDRSPVRAAAEPVDAFARWWARLLGLAPWLIVLLLSGAAAGDALAAGDTDLAWAMMFAAMGAAVWGGLYVLGKAAEGVLSKRAESGVYFDDTSLPESLLEEPSYRFAFSIPYSAVWMPVVAVVGVLLVQWLSVANWGAGSCHALAGLAFGIALWTAVINRIALRAIRTRAPWILGLFVVSVVLAMPGCTDNHLVLTGAASAVTGSGHRALLAMALRATVLVAAAVEVYVVWHAVRPGGLHLRTAIVVSAVAAAIVGATLYMHASTGVSLAMPPAGERPTLTHSVRGTLAAARCGGPACPAVTVYLVGAEGGGIRAGYWIARVLGQMDAVGLGAKDRVFAVSGVSGGSVGAAVWRRCAQPETVAGQTPLDEQRCIEGLGTADLLTPLSSAWMFEDVLAEWVPTRSCAVPGCGLLDRGYWFERALEAGVPGLEQPLLRASRASPYLLLNATQVESGERSVASDLAVDSAVLPQTRDQLVDAGSGLRLSTAAHDSARFPYFNALGSLGSKGHLIDGGLAEGTGAATLDEVLNAFEQELSGWPEDQRQHIRLQVLMVRNGLADRNEAGLDCSTHEQFKTGKILINASGTVLAAVHSIGIAGAGRSALCALRVDAVRVAAELPAMEGRAAYIEVRLVDRKILYPLGWYLSPRARRGMEYEAMRCVGLAKNDVDAHGRPLVQEYPYTLKKALAEEAVAPQGVTPELPVWPSHETESPCVRAWYVARK